MKIKPIIILSLIVALSACSTTDTMNGIMSSWEGSHIREVIAQWGYPNEERKLGGKKVYVWHYFKSANLPQTTFTNTSIYGNTAYSTSTTYGNSRFNGSCRRIFEVDQGGNIVNWQWGGNNCPFGELMEYTNWRKR